MPTAVKLRAYDRDKKTMIANIHLPNHGGYFTSAGGYIVDPRFVVMMASPLTDKEGHLIYDEDIIEIDPGFAKQNGNTRLLALVGVNNGCFMYAAGQEREELNNLLFTVAPYCRVVGNKYQNEQMLWCSTAFVKPSIEPKKLNARSRKTNKRVGRPKKKT